MPRPKQEIACIVKVKYVPCPPEKADAWRRGLLLLMNLLMADDEIELVPALAGQNE